MYVVHQLFTFHHHCSHRNIDFPWASIHLVSCPLPQVFVANPNKQEPIRNILLRNQDKLVEFLSSFHNDRSDDEQFNDEKAYLIKQIRELQPLEEPTEGATAQWPSTHAG